MLLVLIPHLIVYYIAGNNMKYELPNWSLWIMAIGFIIYFVKYIN